MYNFYIEKKLTKIALVAALESIPSFKSNSFRVENDVPEEDVNVDFLVILDYVDGMFQSQVSIYFDENSDIGTVDEILLCLSSRLSCKSVYCVGVLDPFIWKVINNDGSERLVLVDDIALDEGSIEILRDLKYNEFIR